MLFLSNEKKEYYAVKIHTIDIGSTTAQLPIADIHGIFPGPTIVITAGVDGDEYASIDAAYQLLQEFSQKDFYGRLIIVPIVNISGFQSMTSKNPHDNKYPKHIFPGKKRGSASERLMYWLYEQYIFQANVWIDLHGGALGEHLDPYIYVFKTPNQLLFRAQYVEPLRQRETTYPVFELRADRSFYRSSYSGCSFFSVESYQLFP